MSRAKTPSTDRGGISLHISDHALLRFLERAGGMDVEGVRGCLIQSLARAHAAATQIGGGEYAVVADDLVYLVRGGTLITVMHDDGLQTRVAAMRRGGGG